MLQNIDTLCCSIFHHKLYRYGKPDILYLVGRTIIATLVFILICLTLFTIINSPERKIKLGTTLPIALIIGIIFGAIFLTVQIGVITGLIIGVIATFIWELIEK